MSKEGPVADFFCSDECKSQVAVGLNMTAYNLRATVNIIQTEGNKQDHVSPLK